MVLADFDKFEIPVLVDTGASLTMVSTQLLYALNPNLLSQLSETEMQRAIMADGQGVNILGKLRMNFKLQNRKFDHVFYVLPNITYWAVLGTDFLACHQCYLDYSTCTLTVNSVIPQLMCIRFQEKLSVGVFDTENNLKPGPYCKNYLRPKCNTEIA